MAQSSYKLPLSGLSLQQPLQAPGAGLALTPEQQRELANALKGAPHPAEALRLVTEGLRQHRALARILEDIRQRNALLALRQYAAPPAQWPEPRPARGATAMADASRELPRAQRRADAPAPKGP